jgi:hypothetical protein
MSFSDAAAQLSESNPVIANAYAYFCSEQDLPGTVGIGYVGSVCYPDSVKKYRTTVNEYYLDDINTAEVNLALST